MTTMIPRWAGHPPDPLPPALRKLFRRLLRPIPNCCWQAETFVLCPNDTPAWAMPPAIVRPPMPLLPCVPASEEARPHE